MFEFDEWELYGWESGSPYRCGAVRVERWIRFGYGLYSSLSSSESVHPLLGTTDSPTSQHIIPPIRNEHLRHHIIPILPLPNNNPKRHRWFLSLGSHFLLDNRRRKVGRCSVLYESGARDAVDTRWDVAGCICKDGWGVGSAWGG